MVRAKTKGRIFYGWWIVAASAVISACGTGSFYYGFSVFFKPMVDEFGWSRAATAGAFSISRLEGGLEGPIAGWLIDRIGPRKMIIAGVLMTGAGFISMYFVDSLLMFYICYGILLSIGYNAAFSHPLYAAVSNWFIRRRSRAISFYTLGGGMGGTLVVPVVAWLVSANGWRMAAVIIGVGIWATGIPLALVVRHRPEQYGLLPDGDAKQVTIKGDGSSGHHQDLASTEDNDFSAKEALATSSFWTLALGSVLRAFVQGSIVVHMVVYLTDDLGVNELIAASVLSTMTLFSMPGRLLFGWLGDFYDKRKLLALSCVVQAGGVVLFAYASIFETWLLGVPLGIALFVVVYGLSYGASIPLTPALRADFFGRKAFATIGGLISPLSMLGTISGPIFAGFVFDRTQSYNIAFTIFAATFVLAGVVFLFVKLPKKKTVQVSA